MAISKEELVRSTCDECGRERALMVQVHEKKICRPCIVKLLDEARVEALEARDGGRLHRGEDAEYWGRMFATEHERAERALAAFHRAEERAKKAEARADAAEAEIRRMNDGGIISRKAYLKLEADRDRLVKELERERQTSAALRVEVKRYAEAADEDAAKLERVREVFHLLRLGDGSDEHNRMGMNAAIDQLRAILDEGKP